MNFGSKEFRNELFSENITNHIDVLARLVGPRSMVYDPSSLQLAEGYIASCWLRMGYEVKVKPLDKFHPILYKPANLEIELPGRAKPDEIVIVGAHYDTVVGKFPHTPVLLSSPGANDNGSGVAAMLELSRYFKEFQPERTLRFVAFTNEEPPFFGTRNMGSVVYGIDSYKKGEDVKAVVSLDEIGYFTDQEGSQRIPDNVHVSKTSTVGNFLAFVSDPDSLNLTSAAEKIFSEHCEVPSAVVWTDLLVNKLHPLNLDFILPQLGERLVEPFLAASDHGIFWSLGYRAFCLTDTSTFRYKHWHDETDTPEMIDVSKIAQITEGLIPVVEYLVNSSD